MNKTLCGYPNRGTRALKQQASEGIRIAKESRKMREDVLELLIETGNQVVRENAQKALDEIRKVKVLSWGI